MILGAAFLKIAAFFIAVNYVIKHIFPLVLS
jgi:hypothetical protein